MEFVNYHHLLYFWVVAREGGLVAAGKVLRLSHPTLSTQIHALEDSLGEKLFTKVGRRLQLTEMGHTVFHYADEIFTLGREMLDTVQGKHSTAQPRLHVGIADVVPKLLVRKLLTPAIELDEPVRVVCYEDSHDKLLAELALHRLELVISDSPVASGSSIRAHHHLLGESSVALFASPELARKYKRNFPSSLDGAPMLLPLENLALRRSLNRWFDANKVRPHVVAEFEDSALFKVFGAEGQGIFAAPTVIEDEIIKQFNVRVVGRPKGIKESYYAISSERRLTQPAVVGITSEARSAFSKDRKKRTASRRG